MLGTKLNSHIHLLCSHNEKGEDFHPLLARYICSRKQVEVMQLPLLVYLHDLNYLVIKENSYVHLDRIDTMFIMILANFKATKFMISFYI